MKTQVKASLAALVALVVTFSTEAQAITTLSPEIREVKTELKRNSVSLNPLSLIGAQVELDYERRLAGGVSLVATPYVGLFKLGKRERDQELAIYAEPKVGVELGTRFYPAGKAMNGFFIHPLVGYRHAFVDTAAESMGSSPTGPAADVVKAGGRLGYQWFPARRLAISLSAGAHYSVGWNTPSSARDGIVKKPQGLGFAPEGKFALGVMF